MTPKAKPHYLGPEERATLKPRPDLPKYCSKRHRLRTTEGHPTDDLRLYHDGWTVVAKGCRSCANQGKKDQRVRRRQALIDAGFLPKPVGVDPFQ